MASRTIYTRVYSDSSARQLVSGKGPQERPLSSTRLLEEFKNHAMHTQTKLTALVSVSNRIVDTVKRALDKCYEKGEPPSDIWIVFIEVPDTPRETPCIVHAAQDLAKQCRNTKWENFRHEFVFEGEIPENYVLHKVSLLTLMDRGLSWEDYWEWADYCDAKLSTADLRSYIAMDLKADELWEIGLSLGSFAKMFGARAPLNWIAHQLFYDCVRSDVIEEEGRVRIEWPDGVCNTAEFDILEKLDEGIDTVLLDWWLADTCFFHESEVFREWLGWEEERLEGEMNPDYEGTLARIEKEAVAIGL